MQPIVLRPREVIGDPSWPSTVYTERTGYRQKKPYNLELPFSFRSGIVISQDLKLGTEVSPNSFHYHPAAVGNYPHQSGINLDECEGVISDIAVATNKARAKFLAKMTDDASWGENLAEWKETKGMVASRLIDLGDIFAALLTKRPSAVRKQLLRHASRLELKKRRITDKKLRRVIHEPAKAWIEFHFAIEPMYHDIINGLNTLEQGIRTKPIKAVSGFNRRRLFKPNDMTPGNGIRTALYQYDIRVTVKGIPSVTDYASVTLASLGLNNPLLLAWQLLPWSWFLDWGMNMSQYLGQLGDTAGISMSNASTTIYVIGKSTSTYTMTYASPGYNDAWGFSAVTQSKGVVATRSLTFPSVSLELRLPEVLSWERALTALSLFTLMSIPKGTPDFLTNVPLVKKLRGRYTLNHPIF